MLNAIARAVPLETTTTTKKHLTKDQIFTKQTEIMGSVKRSDEQVNVEQNINSAATFSLATLVAFTA